LKKLLRPAAGYGTLRAGDDVKAGTYFAVLLLSVAWVALAAAFVVVAYGNQSLQGQLRTQQQALSGGVLGQQGQQLSGSLLQDMVASAGQNARMRRLLEQHGYTVSPAAAAAAPKAETNAVGAKAPEPVAP
jgi:hypothetical protein